MSEQVLYKKVGRRYVPVKQMETWDYYPEGFWLVHIKPGCKSITRLIDPDRAALEAIKRLNADVLADLLLKASAARTDKEPVTPAQREAWEACRRAFGGMFYVVYPSAQEIVSKFIDLAAQETAREPNP